jgi:hypothetical protein
MIAHPSFGSPSFKLVAKGLVALHLLGKDGKDDSPEAESIRDAMDAPLKALNPIEKERAQWLSEDLYSVSEPFPSSTQKEMNPQAQQHLVEAYEAQKRLEWDRALALLRWEREQISPALLSYLRGSIWMEAGNADVATVFYGHASESAPEYANYQYSYMNALAESDPGAAGKLAHKVLSTHMMYAPLVVARAASILGFNQARSGWDIESARRFRELIPILEKTLSRIEKDDVASYTMTVGLLGFCHELLGNSTAAVESYSHGLQVSPNHFGLLAARGILLYGSSPRAIADFEDAVRLESAVIWPYLYLAHHYLATSRFEQCRMMCETGLKMQGSDTAKSQLEEWRAIAQAELGFSPEAVRAAFEAAIRLDPSNDLARRNQAAFEASLKAPQTPSRSKWEQKSEAAMRQFGLAERRYTLAA